MSDDRHRRGVRNAALHNLRLLQDQKRLLNLTYRDLSGQTGASGGYLRHIHAGRCPRVGLALALRLEKALACRRGEIFTPIPVGAVSARGEYQDTG